MITHLNPITPTPRARPALVGSSFTEPGYNSTVLRVTGNKDAEIPAPIVGGKWHIRSRHRYSKRAPWNGDGTKILIDQKTGGIPVRMVLDAATLAPLWCSLDANARGNRLRDVYEVQWRPGAGHETQMVSYRRTGSGAAAAIVMEVWDTATTAGTVLGSVTIPGPSHTASGALTGTHPGQFGWIGEGQISDDGNWTVVGSCFKQPQRYEGNANWKDYIVVVNLTDGAMAAGANSDVSYCTMGGGGFFLPVFPTSRWGEIGNVGISCLGNYATVKLSGSSPSTTETKAGVAEGRQYAYILDINKTTKAATPHTMNIAALRMGGQAEYDQDGANAGMIAWLSHGDMNIDQAGNEVVVGGVRGWDYKAATATKPGWDGSNYPAKQDNRQGHVISINLATGMHTHVSPGSDQAGEPTADMQHGSGMAWLRRGWHLISTETASGWGRGELQWVKLRTPTGARAIERLCVHRSKETDDYNAEAHPAANPLGTKVMFASNWRGVGASPPQPESAKLDCKAYIVY